MLFAISYATMLFMPFTLFFHIISLYAAAHASIITLSLPRAITIVYAIVFTVALLLSPFSRCHAVHCCCCSCFAE